MTFAPVILQVDPCPKPRMTQSDRWKTRPATDRYWAFKDEIKLLWGDRQLPDQFHVIFYVPMPKSWSKKKRSEMDGKPHQQVPDASNFLKAFEDCLWENDSTIWDTRPTKIWASEGRIVIKPHGRHCIDIIQEYLDHQHRGLIWVDDILKVLHLSKYETLGALHELDGWIPLDRYNCDNCSSLLGYGRYRSHSAPDECSDCNCNISPETSYYLKKED